MISKSQTKRFAIQRGERVCLSCGKALTEEPKCVQLYSGICDEGPYCETCASELQSNEDRIIGK